MLETEADEVTYLGSIRGTIHDVVISELFFRLRQSGEWLVRCEFREPMYAEVMKACERRNALVYVHGLITARRADREVAKVRVDKIRAAPLLSEDRYQSFFGADQDYTVE